MPRITVVTPSFNQARFVEATVHSVLDQSYPALEYIVVDGGSTDGSVEILENHRSRLAALIVEPDKGQTDAIAKGFARGSGDILCWINSDDLLAPGSLHAVGEFFARHPEIDVVYGDVELIDAAGCLIREVLSVDFHFATLLLDHPVIPQQAAFWRREAYDRAGGLDRSLRFCMDYDLWIRLHQNGARFARIPRTLGSFRLHGDAKTALLTDVHRREHDLLVRRAMGREPSVFETLVTRRALRARRMLRQFGRAPIRTTISWTQRVRDGR